jgi:hypothetical protein
MALIDQIDGAMLAIVDPDQRLVYAWFGGAGVNVYDEDGRELHYFTVGGVSRVSAASVRSAINRMIADDGE